MLYFLQQSTSVKIGRKSVKNAVIFTAFISIKSGRNVDDPYRKSRTKHGYMTIRRRTKGGCSSLFMPLMV